MVTYKCDVCGEEFHDEKQLILGKTYYVESNGTTIDRWYGDVCKDCREKMLYVGQRAMMDWIMKTRTESYMKDKL